MSLSKRYRLLIIDAKVLTPRHDGRSVRMRQLISILLQLGCEVDFIGSSIASWPPYDQTLEADTEAMRELGVRVFGPTMTESVEDHLSCHGDRYDVIVLSGLFEADRHIDSVMRHAPQAAIVYDTVDIVHIREFRQAKLLKNAVHLKKALRLKQREIALAKQADVTLVVSELEKRLMEGFSSEIKAMVVSNIHDVQPTPDDLKSRRDLLFIGNFQHRPNPDAVVFFLEDIFPLVKRHIPEIKAYIIGGHPPDDIVARASGDVVVTGLVEDILPYFSNCRLSIAPLRFGAGVKGKVLMSMGFGLPGVITPMAAEGMHVVSEKHAMVAEHPDLFAGSVIRLYRDDHLWHRIRRNGIDLIEEYFSIAAARRQIMHLFENIAGITK